MDLFISWYVGDPLYQSIDTNCKMLISPTSVPKNWSIDKFVIKPKDIMLDSGSFHYIDNFENKLTKTQKEAFENQLRILGSIKRGIICHMDFAIPRSGLSKSQMQERVEITIENAEKFYDLFLANKDKLRKIQPLAVIQGYDQESVVYCAEKLKRVGFNKFGIGSVARLSRIRRNEILQRVKKVIEIVKDLHVFGVSSVNLMKEFQRLKISSIDSSTPMKEAFYSGIIYSQPLRRYKIETEHFKKWSKEYGYAEVLHRPLPCDCFVCMSFGAKALMWRGKKLWNNLRALHNYYHLKRELFGGFR